MIIKKVDNIIAQLAKNISYLIVAKAKIMSYVLSSSELDSRNYDEENQFIIELSKNLQAKKYYRDLLKVSEDDKNLEENLVSSLATKFLEDEVCKSIQIGGQFKFAICHGLLSSFHSKIRIGITEKLNQQIFKDVLKNNSILSLQTDTQFDLDSPITDNSGATDSPLQSDNNNGPRDLGGGTEDLSDCS